MTRTWNTTHLRSVLCAVLAIGTAVDAWGAAPPAPTGTIYYRTNTIFYAVKPDGSGEVSNMLPHIAELTWPVYGNANPAGRPSGPNTAQDRWFIYPGNNGTYDEYVTANGTVNYDYPHRDLFAVRSNPANRNQMIVVQLTDLFGIFTFQGASACWSNDTNDLPTSFVASWGVDLRGAYEEDEDPDTGEVTTRRFAGVAHSMRIPLTVGTLNAGGLVPISPDTITEAELDSLLWPMTVRTPRMDAQGCISPDGLSFLTFTDTTFTRLAVANAATGSVARVLWNGSTVAPLMTYTPHEWSPSGQSVAIAERLAAYPAGGSIWTQAADGSAVPKKLLSATTSGSTKTAYSNPIWSPDSKYLVVMRQQFSGTTLTGCGLTRVTIADGKTLNLVNMPFSAGGSNAPLRWVSN